MRSALLSSTDNIYDHLSYFSQNKVAFNLHAKNDMSDCSTYLHPSTQHLLCTLRQQFHPCKI
jgi:hypothetical protein